MSLTASVRVGGTHERKRTASADLCQASCDPLPYIVRGLTPFVGSFFGLTLHTPVSPGAVIGGLTFQSKL